MTLDSAEDSLATVLGWQDGVPYARVMVLTNGTAAWDTLEADATGRVILPGLSGGLYRVYAERFLTEAEQALVGMPRAFADGRGVHVSGATAVALRLYADRPESLVISEIGNGLPPPWETGGGTYVGGLFFEVHNNSDEIHYLDGMVFGDTGPYRVTLPDPCPTTAGPRTDSLGIYAADVLAFPGTGSDHPIGPGETRLVAWQAIDHRDVHPTLLDLSDADFEVAAGGGADNPDVPNMLDVGLRRFPSQALGASGVYFLAQPQDPRALPIAFRTSSGFGFVRIARETIVDAVALTPVWPEQNAEAEPCQPMVSPVFDRYEGGLYEIGFDTDTSYRSVRGVQRRALRRTSDGRIILMNTNTSAVDFEHALKTPGWVPEPPEN